MALMDSPAVRREITVLNGTADCWAAETADAGRCGEEYRTQSYPSGSWAPKYCAGGTWGGSGTVL